MTKFLFKVYTEDDKTHKVELDELKKAELFDVDKFIIENGGYLNLSNILADKLSILPQAIKRISILNIRKETEFSVASGNKYLNPLLSEINNSQEKITTSQYYKKMKDYLFEKLESKDYQEFLEHVYNYQNQFKTLISKYANTYHQGVYSDEERVNLSNLKIEVEKKLSIYKNYRGLCICRERSEEMRISSSKAKNVKVTPVVMTNENFKLKPATFSTIEDKTEKYNYDNDEFLDPEEYAMMQGDSESEVKGKNY